MRPFASLGLTLLAASRASAELSVRTVYQFASNDTWLENLAVRSNGIILATEIGPPASLLAFDPSQENPEKVTIFTFDTILGLSGITEAAHDVFYVTGANTTSANIRDPPANATGVWRVDFNRGNSTHPAIDQIARPTDVTDYNGLTAYNETIILASATFEEAIWAFDATTGKDWEVFSSDATSSINGIKFQDGYVYWSNNADFYRAPISSDLVVGNATLIASAGIIDDFAVSPDGFSLNSTFGSDVKYAYLSQASAEEIVQVAFNPITGKAYNTTIIAGAEDSTEIAEPTGVAFGRVPGQLHSIYITTGGGSGQAVDINGVETAVGAQLLEIQL